MRPAHTAQLRLCGSARCLGHTKWASLLLGTQGIFELLATATLVICCMFARVFVCVCVRVRARGRTLCATDLADRLNQSMESCRCLPRACNQTHISHISGSNHMQRLVHAGRPKQARYGSLVLQEPPQLLKAWSAICSLPCKDSNSVNQPSINHYGRCRSFLPASFSQACIRESRLLLRPGPRDLLTGIGSK